MRRLVSADLKRFFRRPSFYVLIVFLFLEILFITEGETAAEQIEELQGQIHFCIVTACFLIFHILYGDEFRTGFMINSIGRGYSRAKISVYMKNLAAFDVIDKVVSFETGGWDNTKKGIYRIVEPYINFWFTFVYPHLSELISHTPEAFYDKFIAPYLDEYLENYFVDVGL